MSYTHTQKSSFTGSGRVVDKNVVITSGGESGLSESIPDSSTDLLVDFVLDVSAAVSVFISSDQAITVKTNSSSTPDDTIVLSANVPYMWNSNDTGTLVFGTDITALYVTNSSGSAALLDMEALFDPTP